MSPAQLNKKNWNGQKCASSDNAAEKYVAFSERPKKETFSVGFDLLQKLVFQRQKVGFHTQMDEWRGAFEHLTVNCVDLQLNYCSYHYKQTSDLKYSHDKNTWTSFKQQKQKKHKSALTKITYETTNNRQ